jgi:geranylgeranyl pyrophosphate synthase
MYCVWKERMASWMAANRDMCRVMLHKCKTGYNEVREFQITENFLRSSGIIENLTISLNCNQSDILRQRTHDVELKKYCVKLLEKFGSLNYTRETLEELDDEARAEVSKLGGNPMLNDLLDKLFEWKRWSEEKNPEE